MWKEFIHINEFLKIMKIQVLYYRNTYIGMPNAICKAVEKVSFPRTWSAVAVPCQEPAVLLRRKIRNNGKTQLGVS